MKMAKYTAEKNWSGKKLSALLALLFPLLLCGQAEKPDSFRLLHTFPLKAKYFTTDKLQQTYLVTPTNEVVKYSPGGQEVFRYNNNTRGELAYIDATDPFNLLLFYPELQAVAILDRTMNETALLLLFSADISNATAIGLANDNNIWVYDQAFFQLLKIAANGSVLASSGNLSAQRLPPPMVQHIVARQNFVYLHDPEKGVFVFDNFGQYHQLIPSEGYAFFQILDGQLILYKTGKGLAYDPRAMKEKELSLPKAGEQAIQARWQGGRLYLLSEEGELTVWQK